MIVKTRSWSKLFIIALGISLGKNWQEFQIHETSEIQVTNEILQGPGVAQVAMTEHWP